MYSCLSFTVTSYDDSFLVQEPVYEHEKIEKKSLLLVSLALRRESMKMDLFRLKLI